VLVAACHAAGIEPSAPVPLPTHTEVAIDTTPKERRRMVPPEVYLRAYLTWFGGLAPLDVQQRAKGKNLFDAWDDYLAALGLPDYRIDVPRQGQSNTLMLATLGRLGEALCARAAEHDLHGKQTPRVLFDGDDWDARFDALHRTFLGYPARLAPDGRVARFHQLFDAVAAHHSSMGSARLPRQPLAPDEMAWAAVCIALVQHPEAELY
jgi:hypothetical protein